MYKKYLAIACFLLISVIALAGCGFARNNSQLNSNTKTTDEQTTSQLADEETQRPHDPLDDSPGDWLVGGDCYEEWPYEERPEINDTTFHAPTQNTFPETNLQDETEGEEISQDLTQNPYYYTKNPSRLKTNTPNLSENDSGLSQEQQAIIQDAVDQVQRYLMDNNLPYRDMPLPIFEIRPYQNDGITGQTTRNKIIIYGFNPGAQLTATITHELIHYQIQDFSRNAPEFWDETLCVLATIEIAGNESGYRDQTSQCKDILNAVAVANGSSYNNAYMRAMGYFFSNNASGLREYIDSSLTQPIFDKMTMDWNKNNDILSNAIEN